MESNEDRVSSPLEKNKVSRKRRRFESDLPTPPPEPVENPPSSPRISTSRTLVVSADDAFGHLSKLHNLVEQILDVRDKSSKLFNRVRQLERVKTSRKVNSELERLILSGQDVPLLDEDVGFAESLLGAMLSSNFDTPRRTSNISRASSSTRRGASMSGTIEQRRVSCPISIEVPRRNSVRTAATSSAAGAGANFKKRPSLLIELPKISKWTRVKAAFKWEKASCNTTEALLDPDLAAKLLRIPENNTASSEISGPPTPVGTISSSSSVDDVFHRSHRVVERRPRGSRREIDDADPSRRSHSLDGETPIPMTFNYMHRTKEVAKTDHRMGSHKSPWGKMKDIMQLRRDSLGRQTSRNSRNEDNHSTSSLDSTDVHKAEDGRIPRVRITSDPPGSSALNASKFKSSQEPSELKDLASRRLTPTLTITVPSSEELRNLSSSESMTPNGRGSEKSSPGGDTSREKTSGQISPFGSSNSGILRYSLGRSKTSQTVAADVKRQQSCKGDSLGSSPKMQRRNSKWNKVKKAFLTSATSVPTSPSRISSYFFDDGDATTCSYSASASAEDLDNDVTTNPAVQAEIQRNYRLLHDKLGTEFYQKLSEWEKLKSTSLNSKDSVRAAREKDMENIRLLSEENLTPEFKKKLEEWKRIGSKGAVTPTESRSLSKRRITDWQLWRSPSKTDAKLDSPRKPSAEFVKKMEEWERIKTATRKDEEQDLKKFEIEENEDDEIEATINELVGNYNQTQNSVDRCKAWKGLEDEEFKCLDKIISTMEKDQQTRLSKLHRVVGSAPEKTQEVLIHTSTGLYRFEGISRQFTRKLYEWEKSQGITPECSTFRLLDPLRYGIDVARPRFIPADLNAATKPRRSLSRSKSVGSVHVEAFNGREEKPPARPPSSLSLNDVDSLETRSCMVGGSVPTIPDEEDISEECDIDTELEPEAMIVDIEDVIEETASPMAKYQPHQTPVYSVAGSETTSIAIPLGTVTSSHEPSPTILVEPDEVHPVVAQACVVEQVEQQNQARVSEITSRFAGPRNEPIEDGDGKESIINQPWLPSRDNNYASFSISKMAAQVDGKAKKEPPPAPSMGSSNRTEEDEDSVTEVVITVGSNPRHSRKYLKTRRLTDTQVGYEWYHTHHRQSNEPELTETYSVNLKARKESPERMDDFLQGSNREKIIINENTLNKIVVPTSSGTISTEDTVSLTLKLKNEVGVESKKEKRDPRSVLVKTKRIVFSPFKKDSRTKTEASSSPPADDESRRTKFDVPPSPVPVRKEYKSSLAKETAPSIRMMIKMYNEKLEASNSPITPGSATSSGSGSPIWRSPVSERRIRSRMEKYQEEVRKAIAGPVYRAAANISGIAKSSTIDFTRPSVTENNNNTSNAVVRSETSPQIFTVQEDHNSASTSLRAQMIRKAKQEFLSRDLKEINPDHRSSTENSSSSTKIKQKHPTFNDIQPLSKADLVKSASVGMINIDPDAFERLQSTDSLTLNRNCDSLPRSSDQLSQQVEKCGGKESRFHQLASKFKRAKLRRSKDKELGSMSTVSMLCRQSLFVDIANVATSKSCPTTPSPQYDEESRPITTKRF